MNSKEFNQAVEIVKKLRQKPDQEELLQLYGLFKQAIIGNNNKGKNKETAEKEYIILVNSLIKKYKLKN